MRRQYLVSGLLIILIGLLSACQPVQPAPADAPAADASEEVTPATGERLILATTTSTRDSGLLDEILPIFVEQSGVDVDVIAVGTGQALQLGEDGNADVLLVHARA